MSTGEKAMVVALVIPMVLIWGGALIAALML